MKVRSGKAFPGKLIYAEKPYGPFNSLGVLFESTLEKDATHFYLQDTSWDGRGTNGFVRKDNFLGRKEKGSPSSLGSFEVKSEVTMPKTRAEAEKLGALIVE